jgi:hypothetical protein
MSAIDWKRSQGLSAASSKLDLSLFLGPVSWPRDRQDCTPSMMPLELTAPTSILPRLIAIRFYFRKSNETQQLRTDNSFYNAPNGPPRWQLNRSDSPMHSATNDRRLNHDIPMRRCMDDLMGKLKRYKPSYRRNKIVDSSLSKCLIGI